MKLVIEFENMSELAGKMIGFLKDARVVEGAEPTETPPEAPPDEIPQDSPTPETQPGSEMTRKDIKAELDRRGIDYNARFATPKLAALLDAAIEMDTEAPFVEPGDGSAPESKATAEPEPDITPVPDPEPEEAEDIFGVEGPPETDDPEPVYDKKAVRDGLVAFIAKTGEGGQDKARAILVDVAGVNRLADLKEDQFAAVMKAVEK